MICLVIRSRRCCCLEQQRRCQDRPGTQHMWQIAYEWYVDLDGLCWHVLRWRICCHLHHARWLCSATSGTSFVVGASSMPCESIRSKTGVSRKGSGTKEVPSPPAINVGTGSAQYCKCTNWLEAKPSLSFVERTSA